MNAPSAASSGDPTVASMFAGCGGSSLGYRMAGYREVLAVEWDPHAAETFHANFPDVPVYVGDIATLGNDEALLRAGLKPGELDVLDGSPPCQGFSVCGGRWLDDPRNLLFREYLRILRAFRPKVFVMENVPGLLRGAMKQLYLAMVCEFRASGYRTGGAVMNAMYYGVPQVRERVIVVGVREDLDLGQILHPKPRGVPVPAGRALEGLPIDTSVTLKDLALSIWGRLRPGGEFGELHPKGHWFNAYKVNPARPSNTITKTVMPGGASGLFHWAHPRALNIAELKRLASFPDDFRLEGRFQEQWARIGNSVPPLLMKAIAEHLRREVLAA
jgi:DNA (cytosine-5)-methyltransferase 1